jgi:hypothetical protein
MAAVLLALAGGPRPTPTPEEQRLFEKGAHALQAGDAAAAETAWQQGYAVAHDPAFLVPIGEAQEKAGTPTRALESYRRYLREAPDAADRADIERRIAHLAPTAADNSAAGPVEPVGELGAPPAPNAAAPPPGAVAPAPGASAPPAPVGNARSDAEAPPAGAEREVSAWTPYNITAYAAAGTALMLLGTAGFFAAQAGSDADDLNRLTTYRDPAGRAIPYSSVAARYEAKVADGERHDRYAKIALGAAAGAAAVSAVFFILDAKHTHEPAIALVPGVGGTVATAGWSWRF